MTATRPTLTLKRAVKAAVEVPVAAKPAPAAAPVEVAVAAPPVHPNPWQSFPELQTRWPAVFPSDPLFVRPLMRGAAQWVAREMGWSATFTRKVIASWTCKAPYCFAILEHAMRYDFDGQPTGPVEAEAVEMAISRLVSVRRVCRWPRTI